MFDRLREMVNMPMMENCVIVEIQEVFPEHVKLGDLKFPVRDHFQFIVKDKDGWSLCQNMGRKLTETELLILDKYLEKEDWKGRSRSTGEMLSIGLSESFNSLVGYINDIPGARINPNILQKGVNLYICIEFQNDYSSEISDIILDFVSDPDHPERSIIFYGKQEFGFSKLLNYYDRGDNSEGFILIRTVWEYDEKTVVRENQGVFQNYGIFAPKFFDESGNVKMIARLQNSEIKGEAKHTVIDSENNVVEFSVRSHFMRDFFMNVIEHYSGPVFYRMVSEPGRLYNYFVVNKSSKDKFFKSLSKHWTMPLRKDHQNMVEMIEEIHQEKSGYGVKEMDQGA